MSNLQSRNLSFQILGVQTSFRKEVLLVKSPQITCSPCILPSKLGKQQFLSNCHVMFKSVRSKCAKSSLKSNYHYLICITSNYMMTGWGSMSEFCRKLVSGNFWRAFKTEIASENFCLKRFKSGLNGLCDLGIQVIDAKCHFLDLVLKMWKVVEIFLFGWI